MLAVEKKEDLYCGQQIFRISGIQPISVDNLMAFAREQRDHVTRRTGVETSDGAQHACYELSLNTGRLKFVQQGMLVGVAPGGDRIALAKHLWQGPYKRGGQRVGALQIVSIKTRKVQTITSALVNIMGGDWRAPHGE